MSTTAGDLVTRVSKQLHGYTATTDQVTSLSADMTNTDSTFTVDATSGQAMGITPGIVEIDSEQLYVTAIDSVTKTCTVANGFGRGYASTTAAAHTAGAMVVSSPTFPRSSILTTINDIMGAVFPTLFAVSTYTGTVTYPSDTYALVSGDPAIQRIIDVQWKDPLNNWQPVRAYSFDAYDGALRISPGPLIGRPLRVLYASAPVSFTAESDTYASCGLPDSCQDVLILGAVARLVPTLDISRIQLDTMEQSDRSKVVPPNAAENIAKYLMAEFEQRLQSEAAALRQKYRTRVRMDYNR